MINLISYSIPFCIITFRKIFNPIVKWIIKFEKFSTNTKKNVSYAFKTSIGSFIYSAFIIYVISVLIQNNYYSIGGYLYNAEKIMLIRRIFFF